MQWVDFSARFSNFCGSFFRLHLLLSSTLFGLSSATCAKFRGSGAQRLLVDLEQPLACFPSSLFSHSRVQYVFYSVNQQPTLISSHRAARCSARRGGSVYLTGTDKFQAVSNLELQASGSFQFRARDSRIANHHRRIGDFRMVMGACVASQISAKLVAQIAMTSI